MLDNEIGYGFLLQSALRQSRKKPTARATNPENRVVLTYGLLLFGETPLATLVLGNSPAAIIGRASPTVPNRT
jgi:hypothetical protein